jgi:orotate phosphoribosyltransferase
MQNVDDLISSAAELAERGFSKGEIADELNVSRQTASWLVERSDTPGTSPAQRSGDSPHDIHVDWSAVGGDSGRLWHVATAMADLLSTHDADGELTVGIEKAGIPIATAVSQRLDTDLASYAPRKHQWNDDDMSDLHGAFSQNFADVADRRCYVVDDTITSGTTITETIESIREVGGEPIACVVLVDKQSIDEIDGVPVHSLVQVTRVGDGS